MKAIDGIKLFFIIIFSFIIGGIVSISLLKFTPLISEILGTSNNTIITKNSTKVYEKSSLAASIEKIYDATVVVQTYQQDQLMGSGSGFVYKVDNKYGYILTNEHVVSDSKEIKVLFTSSEEVEATYLGGDQYLDLAVLRVNKKYVKQIASIGSSEKINLGDTVFTVGSPMGADYAGSVTSGILSGKDRMIAVNVQTARSTDWMMRVLQFDASINPGNSGGPLLNVNGEVIGICSLKLVDDQIEGMGFAIPIEYAMNHVESLEKGKKIEWPVLGISMINVTDTVSLYQAGVRLSSNVKEGVYVADTTSGAKTAGLRKGDIIVKLNGKKTSDIAHLRYELYQHQAGDVVTITYIRNNKETTAKAKLGK